MLDRTISVCYPFLNPTEVRKHFQPYGHITDILPWETRRGSSRYFVMFDKVPNLKTLKASSPGMQVISLQNNPSLESPFFKAVTLSATNKCQINKRTFEEALGDKDIQKQDTRRSKPFSYGKKNRASGKENTFDHTPQDAFGTLCGPSETPDEDIKQPIWKPLVVAGNIHPEKQQSLVFDSVGLPPSLDNDKQQPPMATPTRNIEFDFSVTLRELSQTSSALDLKPKISVSSTSKAVVASFLKSNEFSTSHNEKSATGEGNRASSAFPDIHRNIERSCAPTRTPKKKVPLSVFNAVQSSHRKVEVTLQEEQAKGRALRGHYDNLKQQLCQMQEVVDGMHKRILKEAGARRAVEEHLAHEKEFWKRREETIKPLLVKMRKTLDGSLTSGPSDSSHELSQLQVTQDITPKIECKQEVLD